MTVILTSICFRVYFLFTFLNNAKYAETRSSGCPAPSFCCLTLSFVCLSGDNVLAFGGEFRREIPVTGFQIVNKDVGRGVFGGLGEGGRVCPSLE